MNSMKKTAISCIAAISLLWGFGGTAIAGEKNPYNNSVQGKLGVYTPTGDVDDANYGNGGIFGITYSRYLTDHFILEAGWDGFATDLDVDGSNSSAGTYSQENVLFASGLAITIKAEYPVGPVDFSGGAGIGLYGVGLVSEIRTENFGTFDKEEYDTVIGGHIAAGANFNITSRFFLGIEGTYHITDDIEINEVVAGVPVTYEGDMNGFTVAMTGGFRF